MTNSLKGANAYGPVLACGAASVSFSHKDGEPTVFDKFFSAVKNRLNGENQHTSKVEKAGVATSYGVAR